MIKKQNKPILQPIFTSQTTKKKAIPKKTSWPFLKEQKEITWT